MSKAISAALKTHIALETTSMVTCILFKLAWREIPISGISKATEAVVTTLYEHGLVSGQYIAMGGIVGMTNGVETLNESAHDATWKGFIITVLSATTFKLNGKNTTAWSTYTSGGVISELVTFTDNTSNIVLDGIIYESSKGFTKSAVSADNSMAVDTIDLTGIIGEIGGGMEITAGDIIAGRFDMAEIRVFQVNYEDLTMGRLWLKRGWIGQVSIQDLVYTAEVRGMAQMLQIQALELYSPGCRYDLGSVRCGFNLLGNMPDSSPATVTGTVTSVIDNGLFIDTGRTETLDNIFSAGLLRWTSGLNTGLSKEVTDYTYVASSITLADKMPFLIQVGDNYRVNKGCDKSRDACKVGFNNMIRFGGFPDLPGEDRLLRVTTSRPPEVNK